MITFASGRFISGIFFSTFSILFAIFYDVLFYLGTDFCIFCTIWYLYYFVEYEDCIKVGITFFINYPASVLILQDCKVTVFY